MRNTLEAILAFLLGSLVISGIFAFVVIFLPFLYVGLILAMGVVAIQETKRVRPSPRGVPTTGKPTDKDRLHR